MAVLSNNGRLISSLPISSGITGTDQLLIQSDGVTKRILYSTISSSLFSSLSSYAGLVELSNANNKFTGSFYNPTGKSSNFYTVRVRDNLTVDGKITGNLTGSVYDTNLSKFMDVYIQQELTASDANLIKANITDGKMVSVEIDDSPIGGTTPNTIVGTTITANTGFTGNITSTGTSTFSSIDVNGGAIDGTIIGASSAAAVTGTTITANTGFVGNLTGNSTGNLTGDVYNSTSTKVLESGNTTPTANGGVASALFYGTSSYATQALTAAYAPAGAAANGLPTGGSQYQILAKNTATNYDVVWTNPITSSNLGNPDSLIVWDGLRSIRDYNNFYYNGVDTYVCSVRLQSNTGIQALNGGFTGSYVSNYSSQTITSVAPAKVLNGVFNQSIQLTLNANGRVTMSLNSGQTANVLVINTGGSYSILRWSGSTDGGATANTNIYWAGGTVPAVTLGGSTTRDLFTFRNINNIIVGSAISNLLTKV